MHLPQDQRIFLDPPLLLKDRVWVWIQIIWAHIIIKWGTVDSAKNSVGSNLSDGLYGFKDLVELTIPMALVLC